MKYMLVKIYDIPDVTSIIKTQQKMGIKIFRPIGTSLYDVISVIKKDFNEKLATECEAAFSNHPVSCFIAFDKRGIVGFICYDIIAKDIVGPMAFKTKNKMVIKALIFSCLRALSEEGYAYAMICIESDRRLISSVVKRLKLKVKMKGFI